MKICQILGIPVDVGVFLLLYSYRLVCPSPSEWPGASDLTGKTLLNEVGSLAGRWRRVPPALSVFLFFLFLIKWFKDVPLSGP